ncbi:MAG: DUF4376 domain-containing protein [Fusobacterium gastrosuis]|uniref:DUF4376 domain-containing protein n=1 Tax=Fusobacterium gastrosuis TaxID=1755100 RepID=UPI002A8E47D1|nr:DUF4376 domain-containing protein [Fusobacterium gastrosuis]
MHYIYLDKEKAKEGIALVVAVLEEQNKNYKKDYGENIVEFIGEDLPHYITYVEETDSVREATEEEKVARQQITLEDNQVIIDNIIYTYNKQYQKVVNNKIVDKTIKELIEEGILTLEEVKKIKREELKNIRHEKIQANIEVHGEMFQVRDSDKENFDDVKLMLDTEEIDEDYKKHWILADNSVKPFTAQQIIDVWKARTARKDNIFLQFGKLSMELEACQTVEEIEAIKWE